MSLSALTTAMAVAAAAVPNGEATASPGSVDFEAVVVDADRKEVGAAEGPGALLPLVLAQSTELPQLEDPGQSTDPPDSTDPRQSTDPAQSIHSVDAIDPLQPIDPASSAELGSAAPAPVAGPTQIIVTGRRPSRDDPLEELNLPSFKATQAVDKAFIAPVAFAYEDVMPRPIRKGLRNFLQNLGEPVVFVNFLLQLKPREAGETLGRFVINSTLGVGGIVDVAKRKPFNLPRRDNGFADTLGYYGVKPGPYFYLPLVGPTTLRDFIGGRLDLLFLPTVFGNLFNSRKIFVPVWILSELDRRIERDDELTNILNSPDPYAAMRTYYLQKRQAEIDALRGHKATSPNSPASSNPATTPTPRSPIHYPPRSDSTWTTGRAQACALTGNLLCGLSLVGSSSYSMLAGDLNRSLIVSQGVNASEWVAVKAPA